MPGRNRAWADLLVNTTLSSGGNVVLNLLTNAPTVDTITAIRIISRLEARAVATDQVEGTQLVDIGIGVTSVEAFAGGITTLPSPVTDTEFPPRGWLYVARRVYQLGLPIISGGGGPIHTVAVFDFDLRAMRKIDKGVLFLAATSTNVDGSAVSLSLTGRVRSLCLT